MGISALVDGGKLIPPTFLKRDRAEAERLAVRVIKPETAEKMRYLMRLNVEKGTATRADVPGTALRSAQGRPNAAGECEVKLRDLLPEAAIDKRVGAIEAEGITADSRKVMDSCSSPLQALRPMVRILPGKP